MISIVVTHYLEGFLVGFAVVLCLCALFLIVYWKEKRRHTGAQNGTYDSVRTARVKAAGASSKKTGSEAVVYIVISMILMLLLYLWITPIMPYAGIVEDKFQRVSTRKWNRTNHYVVVERVKRPVCGDIYERVKKGDTIRHPIAYQSFFINGAWYPGRQYAWNTGFWAGIIFMVCLSLCIGVWVGRRKRGAASTS